MKIRQFFRKTWVKVSLLLLGSVVAIFLVVAGLFFSLFLPSLPDPEFPEPANATEAYEQDLAYLSTYAGLEKALDDTGKRSAFTDYLAAARNELDDMTPARFELLVAGAVALADNGHSNVSAIGRTRRVNHLPIRTGPFEDGEFVLQARHEHADLLGAEIVAIEGHPIAEVAQAFVRYFGGIEHRSRFFTHLFINSPALLHAEGFTASPDGATLTLRMPNGATVECQLDAIEPMEDKRLPFGREVMDYRVPEEDEQDWVHLMTGRPPPLYLAEPDEPYLYRFLDEYNGAYIKINFNWDIGERSLTGWLEEVAADMLARSPAFAVVDLRFNGGGTDATADFAQALPALVADDGPIYVVTSRETFSAGIGAAAQIKQFAGGRARIVGGLVGDRLRFVANGGDPMTLPNSRIPVRVWSSWEDYGQGCWDWTECFWLSPFFRKDGVGDLEPDLPVGMNFSDYAENRDAALEAVLADVARSNSP
jgi:hypothetical protein